MKKTSALFLFALLILSLAFFAARSTASLAPTVYEVGPNKPYASIGAVPWEALQAGDTVLIYWRSTPYQEKWVLCRQGTASAPITVRGVAGPNGELPLIDGNNATTRTALNYWNQERGVIKIGGANNPPDTVPQFITIENLEIRSARPPYTFTAADGTVKTYVNNASAIYVEKGENIIIRNCIMHDCGNGFFVASSDALASRHFLVEGNYIYDNGIVNSIYEHNNYTAVIGITFQYNRFGPLRAGCLGNNLKDRSAGLIVRYNWIESGNRQLDLVDGEDSVLIRNEPRYREAFVYGNVLIEPAAAGNRQIAHYGGDSGTTANYRKGTLYFYNNTIVSTRTDRTTILRLSSNEESCDFRNNIVYVTAAGNTLSLVDDTGVLNLTHNWFKPGFVNSFSAMTGTINNDGTSVLGSSPGFVDEAGQNFTLAAASSCVNAGTLLHPYAAASNNLLRQYVKHQGGQDRPTSGALDIGAFERGSSTPAPIAITTTSLPGGAVNAAYAATLAASGGLTPYGWSLVAGNLPNGLTLNAASGVISGTPATAGSFTFTIRVNDSQTPADTNTRQFTVSINAPPTAPPNITTTSLPNGKVGVAYRQTLAASDGVAPYLWALASGSLPKGLTLNSATGIISGTPVKKGTWSFVVSLRDSQAPAASDTQALTIKVTRF
ncbi:MAG: putative Ig domain-containing protein [Acidobacteria bacterium]|nr:putative Ig domain-containing protein [Acidobacteriota bacterium]